MSFLPHKTVLMSWVCLALLAAGDCSPRRVPPATVDDLMEDRVVLDGLVMKCNSDPQMADTSVECANARTAVERLAQEHEATDAAKREAEFEHRRDQLRQLQDKQRAAQESAGKVDAYHLPVLPVDSSATPANPAPPNPAQPPVALGQAPQH